MAGKRDTFATTCCKCVFNLFYGNVFVRSVRYHLGEKMHKTTYELQKRRD